MGIRLGSLVRNERHFLYVNIKKKDQLALFYTLYSDLSNQILHHTQYPEGIIVEEKKSSQALVELTQAQLW